MRIAVVAPANRIAPETAERVAALADGRAELSFHPQCFLSEGHFAGSDAGRADAFVEAANDAAFDAVWFARGGYGSNRILEGALPRLNDAARAKTYLGYSDMGFLLAGLYARGFRHLAHGPVVNDVRRGGGEAAVRRALSFLVDGAADGIEASVDEAPVAAFNLTILSQLLGTPWQPDLSGHVLMVEEVSEPMYRIDRTLFHVTSNPAIRKVAGLRLGRCSNILPNDPDFGMGAEELARHWCGVSGIAYLGRADIGHDADNKIVPFGRWRPSQPVA